MVLGSVADLLTDDIFLEKILGNYPQTIYRHRAMVAEQLRRFLGRSFCCQNYLGGIGPGSTLDDQARTA